MANTQKRTLPLLRLNAAEAIFAPFHDPLFHEELAPVLQSVTAQGVRLTQFWATLGLEWDTAAADTEILRLQISGKVQRAFYNHFVFSIALPSGVQARFSVQADGNRVWLGDWNSAAIGRMDIHHPLPPGELTDVEMVIRTEHIGPGSLALNWFGLADLARTEFVSHHELPYGEKWDGLLNLPDSWPDETPFSRGLLFGDDDLVSLRNKLAKPGWMPLLASMESRARADLRTPPETWLSSHVPWTDTRFLRTSQVQGCATFHEALVLGFVGLIKKDITLARQALRHLLTIIHTEHWTVSDENRLQGSDWDQRCFHEEMITTAVSLLTDWYAWALTPRAHALIVHSIWDKGLAVIERDVMKFPHLFSINQGPWFCRARILGGLLMEKTWPRVGNYVDRAKEDLVEGLGNYILQDGGTDEGFGYFAGTLETTLGGLHAYARARAVQLHDILPPQLARAENYVTTLSAMQPGKVLLDGDNSTDEAATDAIPMLAGIFPDQAFAEIAAAALPLHSDPNTYYRQYYGTGVYACVLGPDELRQPRCIVPEFGLLSKTGHLTSRREIDGHSVRLHFSGSKAHASHTHFDKGNITLELDGHPFLIDRGILRYDDPRADMLKKSSRHNVITPLTCDGAFANQSSVTKSIIPRGEGNAASFSAEIDLTNVWREKLLRNGRKITSSHPASFQVEDFGACATECPIAFHLQALEPFSLTKDGAILTIHGTELHIRAPWAQQITQSEDAVNCHLQPVHHLVFQSSMVREFRFQTNFHIRFLENEIRCNICNWTVLSQPETIPNFTI